jgi:hypothetical protein
MAFFGLREAIFFMVYPSAIPPQSIPLQDQIPPMKAPVFRVQAVSSSQAFSYSKTSFLRPDQVSLSHADLTTLGQKQKNM